MKVPNGRQARFVNGVLSGLSAAESARQAGYSDEYAKKAAAALLKQPAIAAAIQEAQVEIRKTVMFDVEQAFAKCNTLIEFAITNKNSMAAIKGHELACRLAGLLVERLEVKSFVDIGQALQEAKRRTCVIDVSAVPTIESLLE